MDIDASGSLERMWYLTFAVQRMGGVAASVAAWMDGTHSSPERADALLLARCEAAARSFFAQRPLLHASEPPYLAALACIGRFCTRHAQLLEQPAQGDIFAMLGEAGTVLQQFADALGQLAFYPAAGTESAALRREARRCESLRTGVA